MTLAAHVFISPSRVIGSSGLTYPPTTATIVTGERDAVLIDTQFLKNEIAALGDLIERSGKRLTAIYVTHAHGDHCLGDVAYNRIHPILAQQSEDQMEQWIASLDAIERLAPAVVIAGHKQQEASDADVAGIIGGTRSYIRDFRDAVAASTNANEVVAALTAKYPNYGNVATLIVSARARFLADGEELYAPVATA